MDLPNFEKHRLYEPRLWNEIKKYYNPVEFACVKLFERLQSLYPSVNIHLYHNNQQVLNLVEQDMSWIHQSEADDMFQFFFTENYRDEYEHYFIKVEISYFLSNMICEIEMRKFVQIQVHRFIKQTLAEYTSIDFFVDF